MGTRELLVSTRRNRECFHEDAHAETMPRGSVDIRRQVGGQPPGDVTVRMTRITNSGRTVGAGSRKGWSPVPRQVGVVLQTQQSGRVPQVGTDGSPARPLQGSGGLVRCTRPSRNWGWCRVQSASTKAVTGECPSQWRAGVLLVEAPRSVTGVHAASGDPPWRAGSLWRRNDGERSTCI